MIWTAAALLIGSTAAAGAAPQAHNAAEAILTAVIDRVGGDAAVSIKSIDQNVLNLSVREARPDPLARLGKPVRFSLITDTGATVSATVELEIVVTHAVAREAIGRGHTIETAAVQDIRAQLVGTPLTRVMKSRDAVGVRTLRPIAPGTVLLPSFLAVKRSVEPGGPVTVRALAGPVEVTATFIAVDGGAIGDTIRVRNPETRKFIRGRIVASGVVEVIHEQ